MLNFPSPFVTVPFEVPSTTMVAPITGEPSLSDTTDPLIKACAIANPHVVMSNDKMINNLFLMMLFVLISG